MVLALLLLLLPGDQTDLRAALREHAAEAESSEAGRRAPVALVRAGRLLRRWDVGRPGSHREDSWPGNVPYRPHRPRRRGNKEDQPGRVHPGWCIHHRTVREVDRAVPGEGKVSAMGMRADPVGWVVKTVG